MDQAEVRLEDDLVIFFLYEFEICSKRLYGIQCMIIVLVIPLLIEYSYKSIHVVSALYDIVAFTLMICAVFDIITPSKSFPLFSLPLVPCH